MSYVLLWQFSLASRNKILVRHFSCDGLSCHNKPYEPLEVILVFLAVVLNCCNRSYFLYWTQIHKNIYSIHHQLRKSISCPKISTFTNPISIYSYKTLENLFSTHRKQIVNNPTTNHTSSFLPLSRVFQICQKPKTNTTNPSQIQSQKRESEIRKWGRRGKLNHC